MRTVIRRPSTLVVAVTLVAVTVAGLLVATGEPDPEETAVEAVEPSPPQRADGWGGRAVPDTGSTAAPSTTAPTTTTTTPSIAPAAPTAESTTAPGPTPDRSGPVAVSVPLGTGSQTQPAPPAWTVQMSPDLATAGFPNGYAVPTFPGVPPQTPYDPGLGYAAGVGGCSIVCITSGSARPLGFDVELTVTTDTPAQIKFVVWNDDGYVVPTLSGLGKTTFSTIAEDLEPGAEYYALAAAEDANGYVDYVYGSFTAPDEAMTLELDNGVVTEVPYDDVQFPDDVEVVVFVDGVPLPGGIDAELGTFDPDDSVDVRVVVRVYEPDNPWCSAAVEHITMLPSAAAGSTNESLCYTEVVLARWVDSHTVGAIAIGDADVAYVELALAPGLDVDLTVSVGMTLRRVPV